ncbi:hypothetical protein L3Q82_012023 [Scortum barcoo]|uniref:Uncharacterized protein n=1 Tax=Scortum barcoo TaxID=214431 RepID=A0ACB8W6I5_9TELE|nr:hypothetical protein L3Q82_012023 [Scortum barcoo]
MCFARGSLTAIRYRDEILRPLVRPYAGAVGPGFLLMQDNARPHVAGVCQQFLQDEGIDAMDWPARSPDLNPIEAHLGHHVSLHPPTPRCTTDCPGVGGCFSPGLGGDPSGDHPATSSGACPGIVGRMTHNRYAARYTTEMVLELPDEKGIFDVDEESECSEDDDPDYVPQGVQQNGAPAVDSEDSDETSEEEEELPQQDNRRSKNAKGDHNTRRELAAPSNMEVILLRTRKKEIHTSDFTPLIHPQCQFPGLSAPHQCDDCSCCESCQQVLLPCGRETLLGKDNFTIGDYHETILAPLFMYIRKEHVKKWADFSRERVDFALAYIEPFSWSLVAGWISRPAG